MSTDQEISCRKSISDVLKNNKKKGGSGNITIVCQRFCSCKKLWLIRFISIAFVEVVK